MLARELGLNLEMADVECDSLLPAGLANWQPDAKSEKSLTDQLVEALQPYDGEIAAMISAKLEADGSDHTNDKFPVQLSTVDVEKGTARIALTAVPKDERFARCQANENVIEIESRRYSASPMVLQGPGAGPEITASGLFADILHLSRTLVEWNIPKIY